jgi:GTP-binding protein HflX
VFDRQKKGERAVLVLPHSRGEGDAIRRGEEFAELVASAGAEVLASIPARVATPNPRFYIGSGKADEIAEAVRALEADLVLVDHELTPVQERNLEKHLGTRVVDRAGPTWMPSAAVPSATVARVKPSWKPIVACLPSG